MLKDLDGVEETETVCDTLEHALADLDLVGDADTVTDLLADLVFSAVALADLSALLLRDMRADKEGVVVWDSDADFLAVAVVQILEVVL